MPACYHFVYRLQGETSFQNLTFSEWEIFSTTYANDANYRYKCFDVLRPSNKTDIIEQRSIAKTFHLTHLFLCLPHAAACHCRRRPPPERRSWLRGLLLPHRTHDRPQARRLPGRRRSAILPSGHRPQAEAQELDAARERGSVSNGVIACWRRSCCAAWLCVVADERGYKTDLKEPTPQQPRNSTKNEDIRGRNDRGR